MFNLNHKTDVSFIEMKLSHFGSVQRKVNRQIIPLLYFGKETK